MTDYRITTYLENDDGSVGFFWRNGDRWLRERGVEKRLLDIAPNLEKVHQKHLNPNEELAKELSLQDADCEHWKPKREAGR